jgi:hypothetical protein
LPHAVIADHNATRSGVGGEPGIDTPTGLPGAWHLTYNSIQHAILDNDNKQL